MAFKIQFEGLELLKKQLKKDVSLKSIIPDVSLSLLKYHNALEQRVEEVFTAKDKLSDVMIGKSVKPAELGGTFLKYSLQYRFKPTPLEKFKYTLSTVSTPTAYIPFQMPNGKLRYRKSPTSVKVMTEVVKGRKVTSRKSKRSAFKGFYVPDSTRKPIFRNKIFARRQKRSWDEYPSMESFGVHAPIVRLFGPALSRRAEIIVNKDRKFEKFKTALADELITHFLNYYKN